MKKLAISILLVLLCFSFAFSSLAATHRITLRGFQPENENLYITVNVTPGSELYTTEFYITYDTQSMSYIDGSLSAHEDVEKLKPHITATEIEKGKIKVSYVATDGLKTEATLCKLSFKPKADRLTTLGLVVEHAESFDGEHIRKLDIEARGTNVHVTKIPFWAHVNVAAAGVVAVMVLGIIVVIVLRIRHKKIG